MSYQRLLRNAVSRLGLNNIRSPAHRLGDTISSRDPMD